MGRRRAGRTLLGAGLLALALGLIPAEAAKPRQGSRFAGKTSQGEPISFRVAGDGKHVRRLKVRLRMTCSNASGSLTSNREATFRQRSKFLALNKDGTFSGDVRVRPARGSEVTGGRFAANGRFSSKRRARGAVQERLRLTEGLRCDTGEIHFRARRR